jgi:hypothetical protein
MPAVFVDVDPRTLRLPNSRRDGADPAKLQRQIARYGKSIAGMPPPVVHRCTDGELVLYDGVTRATRAAKLCPGQLITVKVADDEPYPGTRLFTVQDRLP